MRSFIAQAPRWRDFPQILSEHFSRLDSFVVRTVIQLGLMAAFACLLPPLLAQFGIAAGLRAGGKPVSTFRDDALTRGSIACGRNLQ
jgi:hypothetical protein